MHKNILLFAVAIGACKGNLEKDPLDQKIEAMGQKTEVARQGEAMPSSPAPNQADMPLADEAALTAAAARCESDRDGLACALTADAYLDAFIVDPDQARAAKLYEQGCTLGAQRACAGLARLLAKGEGVAIDPARAEALAEGACKAKDAHGCYELALMYETLPELSAKNSGNLRAIESYQQACELELAAACHELAMLFHSGRGGAGKDPARAKQLIVRACELGDRQGCLQRGMIGGD